MSKKLDARITCPKCQCSFDFTIYRTIWGEYPENRELVMSDKINVATCPMCKASTKLETALMYTNSDDTFAVWWEPYHDPQIDSDVIGYSKLGGADNYLASAPRISDWSEFKQTILKFERGELSGSPLVMGDDLMAGFVDLIKSQKKKKSGCLGVLMLSLIFTSLLGLVYQLL